MANIRSKTSEQNLEKNSIKHLHEKRRIFCWIRTKILKLEWYAVIRTVMSFRICSHKNEVTVMSFRICSHKNEENFVGFCVPSLGIMATPTEHGSQGKKVFTSSQFKNDTFSNLKGLQSDQVTTTLMKRMK